jgi:hypothetical protein
MVFIMIDDKKKLSDERLESSDLTQWEIIAYSAGLGDG